MNSQYRITNQWTPTKTQVATRDMTEQEIRKFENIIKERHGKIEKMSFLNDRKESGKE